MLPRSVIKVLEDQGERVREMEAHVNQEKQMLNNDMDRIMDEIADVLNARRVAVNRKLEGHLNEYRSNYDILREKVVTYKEKVKNFFHQKEDKDKLLNPNATFNLLLKSIQYYKIV